MNLHKKQNDLRARTPMLKIAAEKHYPDKTKKRLNTLSVQDARESFLKNKPNNLTFLLQKRYGWINHFIHNHHDILEVGSGPGLIREFIDKKIILTDIEKYPWINTAMNAESLSFENNSMDSIIACNTLHHIKKPYLFLKESARVLRKNGLLILFEFELSIMTKLLIQFLKIEGWDYTIDVYDPSRDIFSSNDLMDANIATAHLFFNNRSSFSQHFPEYKIICDDYDECLTFLLSGGVRNKAKTINLPTGFLKFIDWIDRQLIKISPKTFALGRKIVLKKIT